MGVLLSTAFAMALSDADVQKQVRTCGWVWRSRSGGPGVAAWNPAQGGRGPRAAQMREEGPLPQVSGA